MSEGCVIFHIVPFVTFVDCSPPVLETGTFTFARAHARTHTERERERERERETIKGVLLVTSGKIRQTTKDLAMVMAGLWTVKLGHVLVA